jgi:ADP-ribosylglycohydrolase
VTWKAVNTRHPSSLAVPPLPNSYWVEPGRLLGGEYPGSPSRADSVERLRRLLAAGVTYFIDLTEPGELPPYEQWLPSEARPGRAQVIYARKPIPDHSVPGAPEIMSEILTYLDRALAAGHCVYLHCRAGVGRTGTVLGCYLVHRGRTPDEALRHLNELWRANERSQAWPSTPETDHQVDYIRNWRATGAKSAAEDDLAAARHLRERFRGALVGLAVGDALGAAVQHRRPGSFPAVSDLVGGGPFELPRGAWTDDTAMALCLAESLVECAGFDPLDQVERYQRWQRDAYLTSTGECVGITASVSKALATARWSGKAFAGSHDPNQLDKEPLSRLAPAVLFFLPDAREAMHYAAEAARTTQQSPLVLDACRYFAGLLVGALRGAGRQELLAAGYSPVPGLWEDRVLKEPVAAIARGSFHRKAPAELDGGGTILQTLEAVLWALDHSANFREGALLAVNLGLDADVTGAVYGQLAGALYGLGGIPANWRAALLQRERIEAFADRLLACALQRMAR